MNDKSMKPKLWTGVELVDGFPPSLQRETGMYNEMHELLRGARIGQTLAFHMVSLKAIENARSSLPGKKSKENHGYRCTTRTDPKTLIMYIKRIE